MAGSLGHLARVMADGTEVPEEFYFAAGLTVLGAMCGKDLSVSVGFKVEPRLYTVLLDDSYAVKKSTAMRKALEFFGLWTFGGPTSITVLEAPRGWSGRFGRSLI
jgi:hypothetical protein